MISSQSRYDHFDIAPCLFPPTILVVSKALKNSLERKQERRQKYSILRFSVLRNIKENQGDEIPSFCRNFESAPL